MLMTNPLSRRQFCYRSAIVAGAAVLAGCRTDEPRAGEDAPEEGDSVPRKGSATEPLEPPAEYHEAPALAELVEAGELPPVEERLPERPYVVPHNWLDAGNYGGDMLMMVPETSNVQMKEYMYGHSPLRWLNDGLDIGPGLVESWESNDDASEWTLHFRRGLKWSDGEPWSTEDVMFWWEDMVLNEEHSEVAPDEARSGTGKLMEMTAPDEVTIVMRFDAPAPLTADRLAMWVNRGVGPGWMEPKHYMSQFHPRYNPDVPADWATADGDFDLKRDWQQNPESPTMTGWRLRSYREGQQLAWERNPYYWCVDREGNQLPYLDSLTVRAVQDQEVAKLQVEEGQVDYLFGPFMGIVLADVSGLQNVQERSRLETLLIDSGDGTGSAFFFNYDYIDDNMRELIRNPKFRQALSHAFNREDAQKAIYFDTGERTTGTMSVKAIEYHVNDEGRELYQQWRDSYVEYDPERAEALLDEIGVVDTNGDGVREMPDGSELIVRIEFGAGPADDVQQKNDRLERDWKVIGIDARQNPIPPEAFSEQWQAGRRMSNAGWGAADGPNCLVYPQWLVPIEPERWAPLQGQLYNLRGSAEEGTEEDVDPYDRTPPRMEPERGGPIERLWELYDESKVEPDEMRRHQLVWEMSKVHIEYGPFFQGTVSNHPFTMLAHEELRNVPRQEELAQGGFSAPWIHPTPAVYDPETIFWTNPDEHS